MILDTWHMPHNMTWQDIWHDTRAGAIFLICWSNILSWAKGYRQLLGGVVVNLATVDGGKRDKGRGGMNMSGKGKSRSFCGGNGLHGFTPECFLFSRNTEPIIDLSAFNRYVAMVCLHFKMETPRWILAVGSEVPQAHFRRPSILVQGHALRPHRASGGGISSQSWNGCSQRWLTDTLFRSALRYICMVVRFIIHLL